MKKPFPAYLLLLLKDPRVSRQKKLAFPFIILIYWLLPDLMPFFPLDDLLVTVLMTYWFTKSAEKDVSGGSEVKGKTGAYAKTGGKEKYVDVQGEVVDEED